MGVGVGEGILEIHNNMPNILSDSLYACRTVHVLLYNILRIASKYCTINVVHYNTYSVIISVVDPDPLGIGIHVVRTGSESTAQ